jgi:hypothetical protein
MPPMVSVHPVIAFSNSIPYITGSRTQPPKPINDALGELSDKLRDASDPWLRLL